MYKFVLFLALLPTVTFGQFTGSGPKSVVAYPPDGGLEVTIPGRVNTSPVSPADTSVYVTGINGERVGVTGPVTVTNTVDTNSTIVGVPTVALQNGTIVSLSSSSLTALTNATGKGSCTYTESGPLIALGNTATNIPSSPMAQRTAVTITNTSTNANKRVVCVPGGTASATLGKPTYSGGGTNKWEGAQAGWILSCICVDNGAVSTGCTYQVEEERCYQ